MGLPLGRGTKDKLIFFFILSLFEFSMCDSDWFDVFFFNQTMFVIVCFFKLIN